MPPDVREWLPESHLAWFVIDAVEEMVWRRSTRLIAPTVMGARLIASNPRRPTWTVCSSSNSPVAAATAATVFERL